MVSSNIFMFLVNLFLIPTTSLLSILVLLSSLQLRIISPLLALLSLDRFPLILLIFLPPWLPASLPPAAGGRFWGPGGDDLTVDGAQQQHEPDGSKHLGGRYPMRLGDGHIQDCCCHCRGERSEHAWTNGIHQIILLSSGGQKAVVLNQIQDL